MESGERINESKRMFSPKLHDDETPRRKCPTCGQNTRYYFEEFCDSTSIHGLKFIGERGRTFIEKVWWIVLFCVAFCFAIFLIHNAYRKWTNSPVIVTFATKSTPVWEIPFPAVTICPDNKADPEIYNHTETILKMYAYKNATDEDKLNFKTMSLVCEMDDKLKVDYKHDNITEEEQLQFFYSVTSGIFLEIKWLETKLDMNTTFKKILTSEGICYTFNMLSRSDILRNVVYVADRNEDRKSDWSLENGYEPGSGLDAYPRRTFLSGTKFGLQVILYQSNIDWACSDVLGYKVILHHPAETPKIHQQYFRVPLDEVVVAAVRPNMMTTADELRRYSPEDRHCYFGGEKFLAFYKVYTQQNCLVECQTNFTLNNCGCVGFNMPRNNGTKVCGLAVMECVELSNVLFMAAEALFKMNSSQTENKMHAFDKIEIEEVLFENCNCLPACTSLEFEVETSQTRLGMADYVKWHSSVWSQVEEKYRPSKEELLKTRFFGENNYASEINIFFKDVQFLTSERNELYGYTDFFANVGGLLGLFMGFSVISALEILTFLTLRLMCNIRNYGYNYFSGSSELLKNK